jgi:hypothetical protein
VSWDAPRLDALEERVLRIEQKFEKLDPDRIVDVFKRDLATPKAKVVAVRRRGASEAQNLIEEAMERSKATREAAGLSLGQLAAALQAFPAKCGVYIDGPVDLGPTKLSSYRGYYEDLAIECECGAGMNLEGFLAQLALALGGQVFEGYKGGDFVMHDGSAVWVSNWGDCSRSRVVGVRVEHDAYVYIETRKVDP